MKLKRTVQCAKCPWKKRVNPHDIPNGYTEEQHRDLARTIAKPPTTDNLIEALSQPALFIMACHEEHTAHCVGWLLNQLGDGNNIALRIDLRNCENLEDARTVGPQHQTFEETLPK